MMNEARNSMAAGQSTLGMDVPMADILAARMQAQAQAQAATHHGLNQPLQPALVTVLHRFAGIHQRVGLSTGQAAHVGDRLLGEAPEPVEKGHSGGLEPSSGVIGELLSLAAAIEGQLDRLGYQLDRLNQIV